MQQLKLEHRSGLVFNLIHKMGLNNWNLYQNNYTNNDTMNGEHSDLVMDGTANRCFFMCSRKTLNQTCKSLQWDSFSCLDILLFFLSGNRLYSGL